jgi:PAS domain S-box-containing protein
MPKHQLSQNASNESTISIHILLNAIAEATCSLDAAGQVTFCNETFLMVTGFRAEEIIGKSLHDLVHHHSLNGSSLNGTGCGKNGCVLCGTPNQQRQIHVVGEMLWRKNGTFFPGEYWLRPLQVPSGITQSVVTIYDITERQSTEEKLRRTQANLAESQRLTHIGSWSWKTDQRENVYWSDEHYRIFGMDPRVGNLGLEESLARFHPEDIAPFRELVRKSVATKTGYETTARIVLPDGSIRNIRGIGNPVLDVDGNVVEFIGTTTDITEQKRAEKELKLAQFSLEHDSGAIHWVDPSGRIVYTNEGTCRLLECSREELLSLSVLDIAPKMTQQAWETFWEALKSQGTMTLETENKSRRGRIFPVEVNATYLEFDGKEYAFAFVRDITERKQIEERLRTLSSAV